MWKQPVEPFLHGGLGPLPLATLCRMPEDKPVAVEEGRIEASQRFLLKLGRKLLGPPDPSVESALTSIQEMERLERMGETILTVKSWEELLSTP